MHRWLFDREQRLRNGWWVLIFLAILTAFLLAMVGFQWACRKLGIPGGAWLQIVGSLALLGSTWSVLKLRKESIRSVGFDLNRRWFRDLGWGALIGMGQILLAVLAMWAFGGVRLELNPAHSLRVLASGAIIFFFAALNEETLYRGFLFQRLRDGLGVLPTQLLLALLFSMSHWGNPGMHGLTRVWAALDLGIGALVFGLAYLRTGGLALPIGLHLGWNWMQGHVLGFGVSGFKIQGWLRPVFLGKAEWLTGGSFGIEASVFAVAVDLLLLALLMSWKGTSARHICGPVIPGPGPASATTLSA
jgi:membrane protease YdiL (CAAX protease family)